jgi:hypothetical protein
LTVAAPDGFKDNLVPQVLAHGSGLDRRFPESPIPFGEIGQDVPAAAVASRKRRLGRADRVKPAGNIRHDLHPGGVIDGQKLDLVHVFGFLQLVGHQESVFAADSGQMLQGNPLRPRQGPRDGPAVGLRLKYVAGPVEGV